MPSLHYTPLKGIALQEFYDQQEIEKHRDDEDANYDRNPTISEPILDCIVSSRKEDPSSPAGNYASDCDTKRKEDICTYTYKSNHVYNDTKRGEEGYLSDTILDEVLNCDYTSCTSETRDHTVSPSLDNRKRQNQTMLYEEQYDIIGNEVNSRIGTVIDTRKRLKSHHAYHQKWEEDKEEREYHPSVPPTQQHSMISSSASSLIGNTVSSHDEKNGQDTSLHDSFFFWEDETPCTHDTAASVALTEGTKSCEPKQKKSGGKLFSFEERFEELKAFKAKHGHCTVKKTKGDDKPLGRWCSRVRRSIQRMKNNEAPLIAGLSEDHIKRLEHIGFDWEARKYNSFEKRFQELKAYKTKHGHCNVRTNIGDDQPLGRWCSLVRQSLTKMKNNEAPIVQGLSEDRIRRLEHIGFDLTAKKQYFEEHFEELKAYKAKHGHCNVNTQTGDDQSLGRWCSLIRHSMRQIKNNEAPFVRGLSEDNIRRFELIVFEFKVKNKNRSFEERFQELKAYKAKHGHCNVNVINTSNDLSLGRWCSIVRHSMKKMKNNEASLIAGLSEDNIRRLEHIGFDLRLRIRIAHLKNASRNISRNSKHTRQSTDTAT